jgi:hypothetical protein
MASKNFRAALSASLFFLGCGATASVPALVPPDSGSTPVCPAGPNASTAPASALPSGACASNEGPCDYEATPCPSVVNGTVNGYVCVCQSGTWSCNIVNQTGLCAPLPEYEGGIDGATFPEPDSAVPDAKAGDAAK